jgi:hypothetical protein
MDAGARTRQTPARRSTPEDPLKLYVCWGTFPTPRPGGHPCANALDALHDAGHEPEVVRSYGFGPLPDALNRSDGRRTVKRLTGQSWVPVLLTDEGDVVQDSKAIAAWAAANPVAPAVTPADC